MKINYDVTDLIHELKQDINEFGNFDLWAIYKRYQDVKLFVSYDYVMKETVLDRLFMEDDEEFPKPIEVGIGEGKVKMKAIDFLKLLEEQNSPL